MKILHVHHKMDVGGAENVILELARNQQRLGHDVTICCLFGEASLDHKVHESGIPLIHLRSRTSATARVRALYHYLESNRYDILHSHWHSWIAAAIAGLLRRTPHVHTHHGNQSRSWAFEQRVASWFTPRVVSLTPQPDEFLTRWVGVPERKLVIIPNGIDLATFENAQRIELDGVPPEAPVVGMVARMAPPKDYPTFITAAALVQAEHPEVHFLAVGHGKQQPMLEQQVASIGLRNFHFLGARKDVPSLFRRMAISVLATRSEGHPLALLEAMASDCPVIASDILPVRFTLQDGEAGVLVAGENPRALADAIVHLLEHPKESRELARRAHACVQAFSIERMTADYLRLYNELATRI
jgi:glycosyltransferase involved in cell wall biosynthesis